MGIGRTKTMSQKEHNKIIKLFKEGYEADDIATMINYNVSTVKRHLRGRDTIIRNKDLEIYRKYKSGIGLIELKLEYNISLTSIEKILFKCTTNEIVSSRRA